MQAAGEEVLRYLPHRPPFVMLDSITLDATGAAYATLEILPRNILLEAEHFSAAGLVEHLAQAAGAVTGMRSGALSAGPQLGYIGAVKDLRVFGLPRVGQTLHSEVIFAHQVMNALIVRGTVRCEDEVLLTCELKIFLQP